jgi:lysine-N-methylase
MKLTKPSYFDTFRCIAGDCPDSCCKEWDVQIDSEKAALYRSLPGDLGNRLRDVLHDEDGETVMTIIDGRCPMWRTDGLCQIQAELGEDALCKTCREFPRLTHDYGDFVEMGLELSCPEAARIILSSPAHEYISREVPGGEAPEYDEEAMEILLRTRENIRRILADVSRPISQVLALAMMYGYQAQAELDGAEEVPFDLDAALEEALSFARPDNGQEMLDFFSRLEILTDGWAARLAAPNPADWEPGHLTLARYFVDRYWLQAVSDYDLVSRVKLMIISCLMIRMLGGALLPTAQLYSKEIENSIDNVEALLDGAYTSPAFTDDRLLSMLLQ